MSVVLRVTAQPSNPLPRGPRARWEKRHPLSPGLCFFFISRSVLRGRWAAVAHASAAFWGSCSRCTRCTSSVPRLNDPPYTLPHRTVPYLTAAPPPSSSKLRHVVEYEAAHNPGYQALCDNRWMSCTKACPSPDPPLARALRVPRGRNPRGACGVYRGADLIFSSPHTTGLHRQILEPVFHNLLPLHLSPLG
jgi:hypothetical protein